MKCARNMLAIIIIINSIAWTQVIQSVSHEQCTMPPCIARIIAEQEKSDGEIQSLDSQKGVMILQQDYIIELLQERKELVAKICRLQSYIYYGFPAILILMVSLFFLKQ